MQVLGKRGTTACDVSRAAQCYARSASLAGVRLVRRLRALDDKAKLKAEVLVHCNEFEQVRALQCHCATQRG